MQSPIDLEFRIEELVLILRREDGGDGAVANGVPGLPGYRLPVNVQLNNVARDLFRRSRYLTGIALALLSHTPFRLTMVESGKGQRLRPWSDPTRCNMAASDRRICLLRGASAFCVPAAVLQLVSLWQCEGAIVLYCRYSGIARDHLFISHHQSRTIALVEELVEVTRAATERLARVDYQICYKSFSSGQVGP